MNELHTPDVHLNLSVRGLKPSATIAINELSDRLRREGRRIYKLGLGQSPFPVPTPVVEALRLAAPQKDYLPVKGLPALRQAVSDYHRRRHGLPCTGEDVLVGPGSKELMFLLQLAFYGELVVPAPAWVSYAPQARIVGRTVRSVMVQAGGRWLLQAADLQTLCREDPSRPRIVVLNYPSNPTGTTYTVPELEALAEVAARNRVVVLSDEIYGELHHQGQHVSIARFYPEGTIVSSGLSKWCGAGGWRLGTFTFPSSMHWLLDAMSAVASETFTSTCAPVQHAAVRAFECGLQIERYLVHARRVLRELGRSAAARLRDAGAEVAMPEGGFYLFPRFEALSGPLRRAGIATSEDLCCRLLAETGVAVLPGVEFGRPAGELCARIAYVDFDGARALARSETVPPDQPLPEGFLEANCHGVLAAIDALCGWMADRGARRIAVPKESGAASSASRAAPEARPDDGPTSAPATAAPPRLMDLLVDPRSGRLITDRSRYLALLWEDHRELKELLAGADSLPEARARMNELLVRRELDTYATASPSQLLQLATIRDCVQALRSIISEGSEQLSEAQPLRHLWQLAREAPAALEEVSPGFLLELVALLRGASGLADIYPPEAGDALPPLASGREAAQRRSEALDVMSAAMDAHLARFPSGLEPEMVERRACNRARILEALDARPADWDDYRWQLDHVFKGPVLLRELVGLSDAEAAAIERLVSHRVPFGITPQYLSLMDADPRGGQDRAVRAQVLPPLDYVERMVESRGARFRAFDFMGEADTSPEELITRRYPRIAILKPFNTCSQICVYCQRNWEIDECMAPDAMAPEALLDRAVAWLAAHPAVEEVLVTGGDPVVMPDSALVGVLQRLAAIDHLRRIRIGTRTPVVLPQRWTDELADLVARFHEPGRREVAIVTHFEHPSEVTPEALIAVQRIRRRGLSVYNQQVFTVENSRRFETARLRQVLRSIGVDPYYTFNMKGKEETRRYRVPIARLLQERKEEARLLPGLDRTDEPVFNVPRLGKNHLRLWQDHRLLAVRADGRRVYSFHPWEKNISLVPPYVFVDVSIFDYLQELAERGEDLREYRTIWYYL